MKKNKKRRYHVVSIQDECYQFLGSAKTYNKALAIVYGFFHEIIEENEEFTIKRDLDTANHCWEAVTAIQEKNEHHARLEYPVMIFYEDKCDDRKKDNKLYTIMADPYNQGVCKYLSKGNDGYYLQADNDYYFSENDIHTVVFKDKEIAEDVMRRMELRIDAEDGPPKSKDLHMSVVEYDPPI